MNVMTLGIIEFHENRHKIQHRYVSGPKFDSAGKHHLKLGQGMILIGNVIRHGT